MDPRVNLRPAEVDGKPSNQAFNFRIVEFKKGVVSTKRVNAVNLIPPSTSVVVDVDDTRGEMAEFLL